MPPKQVIDMNAAQKFLSFLIYGASRTGKTQFCATMPKPLFIMDGSERGWVTLQEIWQHGDREACFYDPNTQPTVWPVSSGAEMAARVIEAEGMLKADPLAFGAVIIDSLTFYTDSLLAGIVEAQGSKYDPRKAYGELAFQLNYLMTRVNNLPCHTVYICLEKEPEEEGKKGNILLAGGTQFKAPARCNYWWHTEKNGVGNNVQYQIFTDTRGRWPAGGRDAGRLPNPLPSTNFKYVEETLGLPPFVTKASNKPAPTAPRSATLPASRVTK